MRALWGRRQSLSHPGGSGLTPAWPQAHAATAGHGHCSEEHGLLLPRQQAVRGGRHGLDVDLGRDTWISWEMPAPGRRLLGQRPEPSPQRLQGAEGQSQPHPPSTGTSVVPQLGSALPR